MINVQLSKKQGKCIFLCSVHEQPSLEYRAGCWWSSGGDLSHSKYLPPSSSTEHCYKPVLSKYYTIPTPPPRDLSRGRKELKHLWNWTPSSIINQQLQNRLNSLKATGISVPDCFQIVAAVSCLGKADISGFLNPVFEHLNITAPTSHGHENNCCAQFI